MTDEELHTNHLQRLTDHNPFSLQEFTEAVIHNYEVAEQNKLEIAVQYTTNYLPQFAIEGATNTMIIGQVMFAFIFIGIFLAIIFGALIAAANYEDGVKAAKKIKQEAYEKEQEKLRLEAEELERIKLERERKEKAILHKIVNTPEHKKAAKQQFESKVKKQHIKQIEQEAEELIEYHSDYISYSYSYTED